MRALPWQGKASVGLGTDGLGTDRPPGLRQVIIACRRGGRVTKLVLKPQARRH
ncbi:MAG TPA: hypothetical protein VFO35_22980 [Steroidobacteraceae bacterium]|nr:hypothetical protein [Steroidobacteraceae bacterium]